MTVLRIVPSCEKSAIIYLGPVKDQHTPTSLSTLNFILKVIRRHNGFHDI